ncbi:uncharacterized protein [Physcomitrium patens]|uniref:Rho termination factor-like N-terminal domain-containing protein n=1 Tax=Physcomitrium patens TaxID=3218 RepID=A0A7I4CIB6_PHYPA|nr:rho-N domain-containing protein 1, chloroplastic-like isoform X1 [Physcomitrium patens]|eukprot:XP_024363179.1 rho-N domain-containing protein 1, chloroplastic-like isoform X1 [Physcomitrella patens]
MATALTSAQLQRPQHEVVDGVVRRTRDYRTSAMRVRPAASLLGCRPKGITSESRGKIYRVSLLRTLYSTKKGHIRATSEGEHDITDVQETDKVSGEWWQPVLSAVHDWSKEKLSGLAELADGSLFFSFSKSTPSADAAAQPRIQHSESANVNVPAQTPKPEALPTIQQSESANVNVPAQTPTPEALPTIQQSKSANVNVPAQTQTPEAIPTIQQSESANVNVPAQTPTLAALSQRHPSSFRKKSPIPAARSRRTASKAEVDTAELVAAEDKETPMDSTVSSISARPERPASSFSRKSPIPKSRERSSVSSSKRRSSAEVTSSAEAPSKPKFTKRSPISRNQNSSRATRSEKKSHSTEVAPTEVAPAQSEPVVSETESDSPVSPELKEILNDGKQTAGQDAEEDVERCSVSVPKKKSSKPSKVVIEDNEVAQSEAVENGAVSKNLSSYKLPELRSMAKAKGLKGYSKLKKGELVELIAASEVPEKI